MSFKQYVKEMEEKDLGSTTLNRDEIIKKIKKLTGDKGIKKAEDMEDEELVDFYKKLRYDMIHAKIS